MATQECGGFVRGRHCGESGRSMLAPKVVSRMCVCFWRQTAASVANLPGDLVEAANILAIRLYEENKSGQGDVVGVSDFGQVFYSKAMPQRVQLILQPYRRVI